MINVITQNDLDLHKKWLNDELDGVKLISSVGKIEIETDLSGANLSWSDLSEANLSGANLSRANLSGANLSRAKNLLNSSAWLSANFEHDDLGWIVYKAIGNTNYKVPDSWKIESGAFIEEVVNPLPTCDCTCGVNFGTLAWIKSNISNPEAIWRCRIHWIDTCLIVVPYNTDGKARCGRLELLNVVKTDDQEMQ